MDIEVVDISQLVDQPQGTVIEFSHDVGCDVVLIEEAQEVAEASQAGESNQDDIVHIIPEHGKPYSDGQIMTVAEESGVFELLMEPTPSVIPMKQAPIILNHARALQGQNNMKYSCSASAEPVVSQVAQPCHTNALTGDPQISYVLTSDTVEPVVKQEAQPFHTNAVTSDAHISYVLAIDTVAPVVMEVTQPCHTNAVTSDAPISYVLTSDTVAPVKMEVTQPFNTNAVNSDAHIPYVLDSDTVEPVFTQVTQPYSTNSVTSGGQITYITTGDTMKPVVPEVIQPGSSGAVASETTLVHLKQDLSATTAAGAVIDSQQNKKLGVRNHVDVTAHLIKMIGGYQCSACPLKIKRVADAKVHIRTHTQETPYSCTDCAKKFTRKQYLFDHMKSHWAADKNDPRPHACDLCDRRFMHRNHLTQHLIVHTREEKYKVSDETNDLSKIQLACDKCTATYDDWINLRKHVQRVHTKRKEKQKCKSHLCILCKKAFPSTDTLKNHIARHRKDCRLSCTQCINKFYVRAKLDKHMLQHTKGKTFCPKCGWNLGKYVNEDMLQNHLTDCAGLTYLCTHCRIDFNTLESYQAHVDEIIAECKNSDTCDSGVVMKLECRGANGARNHVAPSSKKTTFNPRVNKSYKLVKRQRLKTTIATLLKTRARSQAAARTLTKVAIIDVKGSVRTPITRSQKTKIPGTNIIREVINMDDDDDDDSWSGMDTAYDDDDDDDAEMDFHNEPMDETVSGSGTTMDFDNQKSDSSATISKLQTRSAAERRGKANSTPKTDGGATSSKLQTRSAAEHSGKANIIPKTHVMKEEANIYPVKKGGELVQVVVNDDGVGTVVVSNVAPDYILDANKEKTFGEGCGFRNKEDKNAFFIKVDTGFKCSSCDIVMKRLGDIKVHIRTHTGESPYACQLCPKKFTRGQYLIDHMKKHRKPDAEKARQHACHFCERRYLHRNHLKRHLAVAHSDEKRVAIDNHDALSHACHLCDRRFSHLNHLTQHLEVHSRTNNRARIRFTCNMCQETFCARQSLRVHIKAVHLETKQHKCVLCKKGFFLRNGLDLHIAGHRKDKTWSCPHCVNKYLRKGYLKVHMKQHDKGKSFCTKCGRKFHDESSMEEHLESCVGMTYDCNHCHETYHTLESYQAHVDQLIAECTRKGSDAGVVMRLDDGDTDNDSNDEEGPIDTRATRSKPHVRKAAKRHQKVVNAAANDGGVEKNLHVTRSTSSKPRVQNAATGCRKMIAGSATEVHVIGEVMEMSEVDTATSIIVQHNASKVAPLAAPRMEILKMGSDEKQTFMTNIALKDHGASAQESAHRCAVCDTSFSSKSHKDNHEKSEHVDDVTFMCCFCDRQFLTKAKLFEHCAENHELEMTALSASNEPMKFLLSKENNRMVLKLSTSGVEDGVSVQI